MRNAELRDAAAAAILERHPEQAGRVLTLPFQGEAE